MYSSKQVSLQFFPGSWFRQDTGKPGLASETAFNALPTGKLVLWPNLAGMAFGRTLSEFIILSNVNAGMYELWHVENCLQIHVVIFTDVAGVLAAQPHIPHPYSQHSTRKCAVIQLLGARGVIFQLLECRHCRLVHLDVIRMAVA